MFLSLELQLPSTSQLNLGRSGHSYHRIYATKICHGETEMWTEVADQNCSLEAEKWARVSPCPVHFLRHAEHAHVGGARVVRDHGELYGYFARRFL